MTNAEHDRRIDYIEFSVKSVPDAKRFYGAAFGWTFEDYGPDYASGLPSPAATTATWWFSRNASPVWRSLSDTS